MKNLKKVMALILACAMILGTMSMSVFAQSAFVYDEQISVEGLQEGDSVSFYQVLKYDQNATVQFEGWTPVAPFDTVITAANIESIVKGTGLTSTIAGNLSTAAKTATVAGTVAVGADGKATFNTTEETLGLYMAVIIPADAKTVYNPVFVSADYTDGNSQNWAVTSAASYYNSGAAKKSTVSVDKKAEVDAGTSYDQTWTSTRIGEKVNYTVTTTIPGYGDAAYRNPIFNIHDVLTDLELVGEPTVTVAGLTANDYTVTVANDKKSYDIEFKSDSLKTIVAPTEVTIEYVAVVTSDAHLNVNLEKNEVWVEFTHDYTDEEDVSVVKDDTRHYTYTIDSNILGGGSEEINKSTSEIVKVAQDSKGNPIYETTITSQISKERSWTSPLAEAEFTLYTDKECTQKYKDAEGNDFPVIKSQADGRMTIAGLDAGTYYLKETKAPAGYIASDEVVKFEIIPTFEEKEFTEYYYGGEWHDTDNGTGKAATYKVDILKSYIVRVNDTTDSTHTFINTSAKTITWDEDAAIEVPSSIINTKGTELPSTGGRGTTIFYIVGVILVLGAGVVLVTRRRLSVQ